jgi:hypothetical protein
LPIPDGPGLTINHLFSESAVPNGKAMQRGLVALPGAAVAINVRSGETDWWGGPDRLYEQGSRGGYEPDSFVEIWRTLAAPVVALRNAGLSGPLRHAIENAIELVARCRHDEIGDLTLHSVIATETILNPFNAVGDTSERFSIFAAMLTRTVVPCERLAVYREAKQLYRLRNQTVHQSRRQGKEDERERRKAAFGLFVDCLKAITKWATGVLASDKVCGPEEFKEFYETTIFSAPDMNEKADGGKGV